MIANVFKLIIFTIVFLLILAGSSFILSEYIYDSEWRWEIRNIEELKNLFSQDSNRRFMDSGELHSLLEEEPTKNELQDFMAALFDSYYPSKRIEEPETEIRWTRGSSLWLIVSESLLSRNNRKLRINFLGTHIFILAIRVLGSAFAIITIGSMAYGIYFTFEIFLGLCLGLGITPKPEIILTRKYQKKMIIRDVSLIIVAIINMVITIIIGSHTYKRFRNTSFNNAYSNVFFRQASLYNKDLTEDGVDKITYSEALYLISLSLLLHTATTLIIFSFANLYRSWKFSGNVILTNDEYREVLRKRGILSQADEKDKME